MGNGASVGSESNASEDFASLAGSVLSARETETVKSFYLDSFLGGEKEDIEKETQISLSKWKETMPFLPADITEGVWRALSKESNTKTPGDEIVRCLSWKTLAGGMAFFTEDRIHLGNVSSLLCGTFPNPPETLTCMQLETLINVCAECFYRLPKHARPFAVAGGWDDGELNAKDKQMIKDVILPMFKKQGADEYDMHKVETFCERRMPKLGLELGTLLLSHCLDKHHEGEENSDPHLLVGEDGNVEETKKKIPQSSIINDRWTLWMLYLFPFSGLRGVRPLECGCWSALYSSLVNGTGLQNFIRGVFLYDAPTVLLVKTKKGDIFGFYTEEEWRSEKSFYGSSSCFLFNLVPSPTIFAPSGISKNYMFFHLSSSSMYSSAPSAIDQGLGIGGQLGGFRVMLDDEFKTGVANTYGSTYAEGTICPLGAKDDVTPDSVNFEIVCIEVWGLGGEAPLAKKAKREAKEMKDIMKRRQVNRKVAILGGSDEEDNEKQVTMNMMALAGVHKSYVKDADHV